MSANRKRMLSKKPTLTRKKKKGSVVGLEIEAGSIAAAEVQTNGASRLTGSGHASLAPGIVPEGEVDDPDALADALRALFSENKLGKNVRVGIANQKVVVRTMALPVIEDAEELATAVRFQAQEQIPMPLDQVAMDYEVIGHREGEDGARQMEVVVVAARRDMLLALLDAIGSAGLRSVGIDLSAFGMVRALAGDTDVEDPSLAPPVDLPNGTPTQPSGDATAPNGDLHATLYCSLGADTNIAVARGSACVFTRISPFGLESISQRLAERRQLALPDASAWLSYVGLEGPIEQLEGDPDTVSAAREVLEEGASELAGELRLSLEGYGGQEGAAPIDGIVACGPGTTIRGLPERLQQDLGQGLHIGRPDALLGLDDEDASRLTLPYGLALES